MVVPVGKLQYYFYAQVVGDNTWQRRCCDPNDSENLFSLTRFCLPSNTVIISTALRLFRYLKKSSMNCAFTPSHDKGDNTCTGQNE